MSFLRGRDSPQAPTASEILINEYKKSVKKKIVDSIKDLQIEYADEGGYSVTVSNNELSNQVILMLSFGLSRESFNRTIPIVQYSS